MTLYLDSGEVRTFDVTAEGNRRVHAAGPVEPGEHRVAVEFINDYYRPDAPDPSQRDRNLIVDRIELDGPYDLRLDNPIRRGSSPATPRWVHPAYCQRSKASPSAPGVAPPR